MEKQTQITVNFIFSAMKKNGKIIIAKSGNSSALLDEEQNTDYMQSTMSSAIVVMDQNTYTSIPAPGLLGKHRLILDPESASLHDLYCTLISAENCLCERNLDSAESSLLRVDLKMLYNILKSCRRDVFFIGGSALFNQIWHDHCFLVANLYVTEFNGIILDPMSALYELDIPEYYRLVSWTDTFNGHGNTGITFKMLKYRVVTLSSEPHQEHIYLDLLRKISKQGITVDDRTGVGCKSIFGSRMEFDLSNGILPLITTKHVSCSAVLEELLMFCRGDTDTNVLRSGIWKGNTSQDFLTKRGLPYKEGIAGPIYGWQWRHFGAQYNEVFSTTEGLSISGFDQLANVEELLTNDPDSRRILVSAWNPMQEAEMVLPPCHVLFQFYTSPPGVDGNRRLSCQVYMRSQDFCLGTPFNVASYAILTHILAYRHNMVADKLVMVGGNSHVYSNHMEQVAVQLSRKPRPFPSLVIDESIKTKSWHEMTVDDFELVGYFGRGRIKAPMAV